MAIGKTRVVSIIDSAEPVTLAEAKNYLRVTNSQDDAKITSQITAARSIAEEYINRDVLPRNREQFILQDNSSDGIIELYGAPINSSQTITVEVDGTTLTEDSEWEKVGLSDDPYVKLTPGQREIKITYRTAGLQTDATIKQGTLAILSELYEYGEIQNKWIWTILKPLKRSYL